MRYERHKTQPPPKPTAFLSVSCFSCYRLLLLQASEAVRECERLGEFTEQP
jgi:hypothetical protein